MTDTPTLTEQQRDAKQRMDEAREIAIAFTIRMEQLREAAIDAANAARRAEDALRKKQYAHRNAADYYAWTLGVGRG